MIPTCLAWTGAFRRAVMMGAVAVLTVADAAGQSAPYTVSVRFGVLDTTCYPNCSHPTEWALDLFADVYDSTGALVSPSSGYLYEWGTDYCAGGGFAYGWATGMGLSSIRADGNKQKSGPGCCALCLYQTYQIGVRVTINGNTYESGSVRIPDGPVAASMQAGPAFPNPFSLSRGKNLSLPLEPTTEVRASVYVFTSSFDLVFSKEYSIVESFGQYLIEIPGYDLARNASSGICMVIAKVREQEYRWKVAVLR